MWILLAKVFGVIGLKGQNIADCVWRWRNNTGSLDRVTGREGCEETETWKTVTKLPGQDC